MWPCGLLYYNRTLDRPLASLACAIVGAVALTVGSVPRRIVPENGINNRIGPTFLNYVNFIDCSFSTTNENDVILGRFYVGPILPPMQRPPGFPTELGLGVAIQLNN